MSSTPAPYRHVYVHVPFCARRCSYCDFAITVRREVPVDEFIDDVARELAIRGIRATDVETLYFGGGTPSRLGGDGMARLIDRVRERIELCTDAEVTVEANPEDVDVAAVRAWRAAGVNRLSIGVQSFDDGVLAWMHRVHDADASRRAVEIARAEGIESLSLDLIFALPARLERDWERDVASILALAPDHISLYGLTVEAGTPLGKWRDRGDEIEAPDERYAQEFLHAHRVATEAGFVHYEVSNFGRPGRRSRHNSSYWRGVPYLGVGPAAHGFDGVARRWNHRHLVDWSAAARIGEDPVGGSETLDEANLIAERVYLGLRTVDGLRLEPGERAIVDPWIRAEWVEIVDGGGSGGGGELVRCTPEGWLRLDALASALTERRSRS